MLQVYGKEIGLMLLGTDIPGTSYKRYASQDKWEMIRLSTMAFTLNTILLKPDKDDDRTNSDYLNRTISGLVFFKSKPLAGVEVKNQTTDQTTFSDANGRFTIEAETDDFIIFSFEEMEQAVKKITNKPTLKVSLRSLDN